MLQDFLRAAVGRCAPDPGTPAGLSLRRPFQGMAVGVLVCLPHGSYHYSARRPKIGLFE